MLPQNNFKFDGDVGSYLGVGLAAALLTILTLGIGLSWAICMKQKWIAIHTTIDGKRLKFIGSGGELFGQMIVWSILTIITIGIYGLWVGPQYQKWITEHTSFDGI